MMADALSRGSRGNNNDDVRRHNLSTVLTLVHQARGLSRSELTRRTGLNRSTIAGLVAELVERGLVGESIPERPGMVGRPSPVVVPSERVVGIAVNPEIDAITIGLVSLGGSVLRKIRYETDASPSVTDAVRITTAVIEGMRGDFENRLSCVGVGIAVPGLVRAADGLVRLAPHLDWHDEPLAERLRDATGLPVSAANDASLGAVAEKIFGAGRGLDDLVYLNGGASGVGGGIIAGGTLLGGTEGYAGEFGHMRVAHVDDGADAETGSLERMANRADLLAATGLAASQADALADVLRSSADPGVSALVHRQLDHLAVALRNAIDVLNPQLVVLGGFLASIHSADPDYLEKRVARQTLDAPWRNTRITAAELGGDLLMIGAAELAFEPLLADPGAFSAWEQARRA